VPVFRRLGVREGEGQQFGSRLRNQDWQPDRFRSHHNLFLLQSREGKTAIDHVAFEVRDIHEVFGGGLYMQRRGWPTEAGPGRHPISSAYFWYFKSPCGGSVEYFGDSDYMTAAWKPRVYRANRFSEWHLADGVKPAQGEA
jgi:hypothetical protein